MSTILVVGGLPELVEDGRTGLSSSCGDTDGLAERLRVVLTDPARAIGAARRERFTELRSSERHPERLLAMREKAGR